MIALILAATGTLLSPNAWTQFRLTPGNNAVVAGSLQTSWTLKTKGAFSSSPVIAGGLLYIGNNAGEMFAIDPLSGKVKWTRRVANPIMSAAVVTGNLAIAGEGNEESPANSTPSHPIHVGDGPNVLLAFDRTNGNIVWKKWLPGSGMPMAAIVDGVLVQHNGGGYVLGVNPLTGASIYSVKVNSIASMSAAVPLSGGRFATSGVDQNAVLLMRAKDGAVLSRTRFADYGSGLGDCPMATDGTRLYCNYVLPPTGAVPMQTERTGILHAYAVTIATGKRAWDVVLEGGQVPKRNEAAIPLLTRGMLYMGSSVAPLLHAIDPARGTIRWRFRAHGPIKGGIVEVKGVLYFGDFAGYLWAVNASNGSVIGARRMHVVFNVGSPVVAGQTLIIGSRDGTLFALPLAWIRAGRDR